MAPEIEAKQLHLHTSLKPFEVIANERRIEQVMVNFFTNAIRYTPEQESILVTTSEDQDTVKICIENKGAHIPDEQLEKIWDRFYRGEPSRQRSTVGTGQAERRILDGEGCASGKWRLQQAPDGTVRLGDLQWDGNYNWIKPIFYPPILLDLKWHMVDTLPID